MDIFKYLTKQIKSRSSSQKTKLKYFSWALWYKEVEYLNSIVTFDYNVGVTFYYDYEI